MFYISSLQSTRPRQRGASLLEAIAYLGIAAIIILGAISLLGGAFGGANTNKVQQELTSLRTNILRLYASQVNYGTGSSAEVVNNANMAPGTLKWDTAAKNWINAYDGKTVTGGAGNSFWVSYGWVPKDACVALSTNSSGWTRITIAVQAANAATLGADTVPAVAAAGPFNAPVSIANANTSCSGERHSIVWYN